MLDNGFLFYECTCGAKFESEFNALMHVGDWHCDDDQNFEDRVRQMISPNPLD